MEKDMVNEEMIKKRSKCFVFIHIISSVEKLITVDAECTIVTGIVCFPQFLCGHVISVLSFVEIKRCFC
jgi:hypothetical protein